MDGIYTFKVKGTAFYPIMIGLWTCLVVELWWNILELSIKCVYAFLQLVLEILDCNVCLHFGYLMVVEFHCTLLLVSVEFIVLILFSNGHWLDDRRLTWWLDGPFRSAILSLHYSGQIVCWLSWWLDCASHKVSLGVGHSPSTSTKRESILQTNILGKWTDIWTGMHTWLYASNRTRKCVSSRIPHVLTACELWGVGSFEIWQKCWRRRKRTKMGLIDMRERYQPYM